MSEDSSEAGGLVKVGEGRGFVVNVPMERMEMYLRDYYVITAAHCLPHLPPAHAGSYLEERTFHNTLGPVDGDASLSAECVFVDPVSDLAILSEPDSQHFLAECDELEEFVADAGTLAAIPLP